jgi:hypothetical protein
MGIPRRKTDQPSELNYLEWAGGYHAVLDNGEVDTSIRPVKGRQSKRKKTPAQRQVPEDEGNTSLDLIDWLNRTFDD